MRRSIAIAFALCALFAAADPIPPFFGWPLEAGGRQWVSSGYGVRQAPMGGVTGSYHPGIDIACRAGTAVLAVADGTIAACVYDDPIYGKYVVLHTDFGVDVLYGHLSEEWYGRGTRVTRGQAIGRSGNTGASTGPHLHISMMIDPGTMLAQ